MKKGVSVSTRIGIGLILLCLSIPVETGFAADKTPNSIPPTPQIPADADPVIVHVTARPNDGGMSIMAAIVRSGSSFAWAQYSGIEKWAFGDHRSWSEIQEERIRVNGKIKHSMGSWADSCADDVDGDEAFCVTSMVTWVIPLTHTASSRHRFNTVGYADSDFTTQYSKKF